jgi:hypothetical protein
MSLESIEETARETTAVGGENIDSAEYQQIVRSPNRLVDGSREEVFVVEKSGFHPS